MIGRESAAPFIQITNSISWQCNAFSTFFLFLSLSVCYIFNLKMSVPIYTQWDSSVRSVFHDDGIESKHTCHALPSLQLIIHNQHLNIPLPLVRKHRPPEQNRLSNIRPATTQGKHFTTLEKEMVQLAWNNK